MSKHPGNETADLHLVFQQLLKPQGLCLAEFTTREMQAGPTPDRRIMRGNTVVGFCELKSPHDPWLDDQLAKVPPGDIAGGARPDPTFNRILRQVERAAVQFDAVNAGGALPNVLAIVNHDEASGVLDAVETLTGFLHLEGGKREQTMTKGHMDRLNRVTTNIHLIAWFNARDQRLGHLFVHQSDAAVVDQALALVGRTRATAD